MHAAILLITQHTVGAAVPATRSRPSPLARATRSVACRLLPGYCALLTTTRFTAPYGCLTSASTDSGISSACAVTRLWFGRPENRGSILGRDKRLIFSPMRPYQLWSSLGFLFDGYLEVVFKSKATEAQSWPIHGDHKVSCD